MNIMETIPKEMGFTLIELIIVIIVISIIAVAAFPKWPGLTINLGGQTNQIADDIRYAQALSMTTGQRYRWVRVSTTTYQVLNAAGSAIPLGLGNTTVTLNNGMSFGTLTNLPNNLIAFDGLGTPYTDTGSTLLASTATIPITAGSNTMTISISPETGRVIVQ